MASKALRGKAKDEVARAIKRGVLTRPSVCCLCGKSTERFIPADHFVAATLGILEVPETRLIVAHHWRGYEHPLDVWWVCQSCNVKLGDRHDGSITVEEARILLADWKYADRWPGRGIEPKTSRL
jgi:hypothetical protein